MGEGGVHELYPSMTTRVRIENDRILVDDEPLGAFDIAFIEKNGELTVFGERVIKLANVSVDTTTIPRGMNDVVWFGFDNMIAIVNKKAVVAIGCGTEPARVAAALQVIDVQAHREGFAVLDVKTKSQTLVAYLDLSDAQRFQGILDGTFEPGIRQSNPLNFAPKK